MLDLDNNGIETILLSIEYLDSDLEFLIYDNPLDYQSIDLLQYLHFELNVSGRDFEFKA